MNAREALRTLEKQGEDNIWRIAKAAGEEMDRLEKERFKYETALMLIGEGIPDAASIAKAAIKSST